MVRLARLVEPQPRYEQLATAPVAGDNSKTFLCHFTASSNVPASACAAASVSR